jgi:hypothetical protein
MNRALAAAGLVVALAATPAPAPAQEPAPVDPRPGSASEAVYGIQVDRARRDAAPGGRTGQASRSKLGVGSSPVVPGTQAETRVGQGGEPPEGGARPPAAVILLLALIAVAAVASGLVAVRAVRA